MNIFDMARLIIVPYSCRRFDIFLFSSFVTLGKASLLRRISELMITFNAELGFNGALCAGCVMFLLPLRVADVNDPVVMPQ